MVESLHILLGTSVCLQWLCHSGERTVARGPLVFFFCFFLLLFLFVCFLFVCCFFCLFVCLLLFFLYFLDKY